MTIKNVELVVSGKYAIQQQVNVMQNLVSVMKQVNVQVKFVIKQLIPAKQRFKHLAQVKLVQVMEHVVLLQINQFVVVKQVMF